MFKNQISKLELEKDPRLHEFPAPNVCLKSQSDGLNVIYRPSKEHQSIREVISFFLFFLVLLTYSLCRYRFADFSSLWKMLQLFRGCSALPDKFRHAFHELPY